MRDGIRETAEDERWVKAEWYVSILYLAAHFHTKPGSNWTFDLE